jgi:glycine oxidase
MNWHNYDAVVVGDGLAGAMMVHQLALHDVHVCWVSSSTTHTASKVGAGIMNPITGRRYLLAWRYREFLELALASYRELEAATGKTLLCQLALLKSLHTPGDENEWLLRCADPAYAPFMQAPEPVIPPIPWQEVPTAGIIAPVWRVDMVGVMEAVRQLHGKPITGQLLENRVLLMNGENNPIPENIPLVLATGTGIPSYGETKFPLNPYKGEALIITTEALPENYVLHHRLHIIPLGEKRFWVGAYNRWDFEHPYPTPVGRQWLIENLEKIFPITYSVERHIAGVRPSSDRRRPIVGPIPGIKNAWILNGLGTKGVSLAPYLSRQLAAHILHGTALDPEIAWPWKKTV